MLPRRARRFIVAEPRRHGIVTGTIYLGDRHAEGDKMSQTDLQMTAPVRVSIFLLDLAKRYGAVAPIDLPMSRRDMADHLELPVEMVCRVLSRFAEARLIAIPNVSQVEIIDATQLEAIISINP